MGNLKEHSYLNQAERLFVHEGRTLEEIATRLSVDLTTLLDWQNKGE